MSKNYKTIYDSIKEEMEKAYEEEQEKYIWYCNKDHEWTQSKEKPVVKKPRPKPAKKPDIKVVDNFIDWPQAA